MIVLIADRSQITRLGISSVLRQLGHRMNIREVSQPDKLGGSVHKTSANMLIISASFLLSLTGSVAKWYEIISLFTVTILIRDREIPAELVPAFDEIIEPNDPEKLIHRKIDIQINALKKEFSIRHQNYEISQREKEVLRLVAMGLTNKEIAEKLFISSHTVITHRKNITAKLGIKTIAGLSVYAVLNKLISIEDIQ